MATKPRTPTIPLTEIEHAAFCRPEDELPAKSLAEELAINVRWQKIPPEYLRFSPRNWTSGFTTSAGSWAPT